MDPRKRALETETDPFTTSVSRIRTEESAYPSIGNTLEDYERELAAAKMDVNNARSRVNAAGRDYDAALIKFNDWKNDHPADMLSLEYIELKSAVEAARITLTDREQALLARENRENALFNRENALKSFIATNPIKKGRMLLSDGFPKLGHRGGSVSVSKTRPRSAYNVTARYKEGKFGILDNCKRNNLKEPEESVLRAMALKQTDYTLGSWSSESDIQLSVHGALVDCLNMSNFTTDLNLHTEKTFSISTIFSKHQDRVDIMILVNATNAVTGVCEVKLPGTRLTDYEDFIQITDYMIDLRNSLNVRFVFGIISTYSEWRILWFEDTNDSAEEETQSKYDQRCLAGSASDYSISENVTVYYSRLYSYDDKQLIEVLVSLLYKMKMSPISPPDRFILAQRKYVFADKDSFSYQSLPARLQRFSYRFPSENENSFFLLIHYHRGGDGRIALACSPTGELCVVKFLLKADNEKENLERESTLWNSLWGARTRVVMLHNRYALLMPFCFHLRFLDGKMVFALMKDWNRFKILGESKDFEVQEFDSLYFQDQPYLKDPLSIARAAISTMLSHKLAHDDMKWEHVALMPVFTDESVSLRPVLLDLTRHSKSSQIEASRRHD